jgi:flagellar assembly factor FliW
VTAPVTQAGANGEMIFVASRLFGPLNIDPADLIVMPEGMLGFAGERRFVLLPAAPDGVFWLQNVDDGALIFLLIDPFTFFPDYSADAPDIPEERTSDIAVLAIVTLPRKHGDGCSVNLQGPLLFDFPRRQVKQVIQEDPRYHTRHAVDLRGKLG